MATAEVHRTLVKSPPELWSELSDATALGTHLCDFGTIRITRLAPETTIEWESDSASGTVELKTSGWGTRVTLSVAGEVAPTQAAPDGPSEQDVDPEPVAPATEEAASRGGGRPFPPTDAAAAPPPDPFAALLASATTRRLGAEAGALPKPLPEPGGQGPAPDEGKRAVAASPATDRRPRLLARLRSWRARRGLPIVPPQAPAAAQRAASSPPREAEQEAASTPPRESEQEPASTPPRQAEPHEEPVQPPAAQEPVQAGDCAPPDRASDEPTPAGATTAEATPAGKEETDAPPKERETAPPNLTAELQAAEEAGAEDLTTVLTAVLDRLGAAHHRPFSRA